MEEQDLRRVMLLLGAAVCSVTAGLAAGQTTYPTKPIRMIAPYPPGGTSDIVARIVGQKLIKDAGIKID